MTEDFIEVWSECKIRYSRLTEFGGKGERQENRSDPIELRKGGRGLADEEKEFWVLAVKLLFKRIEEGQVILAEDRMPEIIKDLKTVTFDEKGNPIFETITPRVRSLANAVFLCESDKLKKEAQEREQNSPVHEYLKERVDVTDEVLQKYSKEGRLSELSFELYKEAGCLLSVCAHSYVAEKAKEMVLKRDQAICAGLLVRITKFMIAVVQLVAGDTERREVVMALSRSILESTVNLRFLLLKNEKRFFDQFVKFSLAPERELYDQILRNIGRRGGVELPIETRMLASIKRTCRLSGITIEEVDSKYRDWGGGLRNRLKDLGQEDVYVSLQRIPSHAVHGTWVDLILHHLEEKEDGFSPRPAWSHVDARFLAPVCLFVIDAVRDYMKMFVGELPEVKPLYARMDDLQERVLKLDEAHEAWLSGKNIP